MITLTGMPEAVPAPANGPPPILSESGFTGLGSVVKLSRQTRDSFVFVIPVFAGIRKYYGQRTSTMVKSSWIPAKAEMTSEFDDTLYKDEQD